MPFGPEGYVGKDRQRVADLTPLSEEASYQAQQASLGLQGLQDTTPLANTPQAQAGLVEGFAGQGRRVMAYQADQGMLSSSQIGQAQASTLRSRTEAELALQGSEEAVRRAAQMKWEAQERQAQASMRQLPDQATRLETDEELRARLMVGHGDNSPYSRAIDRNIATGHMERLTIVDDPFKDPRKRAEIAQRESVSATTQLRKLRPTAEQLTTQFQKTADTAYGQYSAAILGQARKQGMSESYLKGLQASLDNDKQAVMNSANRMILDITGPDPAAAASALASMYSPEKIEAVTRQRTNPLWGLLGAAAGFAVGGPGGAMVGYNLGNATGEAVGGDVSGVVPALGVAALGAYGINNYLDPGYADTTKAALWG